MTSIKYNHLGKSELTATESYDPNLLINVLLEKMRLKKDSELARQLELDVKTITQIRENRLKISPSMLVLIEEATGISVPELRKMLKDKRTSSDKDYFLSDRRR